MRLSPRDPILTYWLNFAGRAELELRHDGRAIGYFRRGIALNPRHTGTLASLTAAHALSGNVSEARTYLSELQKAAPQLSPEQLMERFGGAKGSRQSRMKEGLRLAFAGLM
jgi:Tfp pilus assembly protein PilF